MPKLHPCTDHTGQTFPSQKAMAEAWGISPKIYMGRVRRGWSVEEALTGRKTCSDHTGRVFPTIKDMCEYWGIPRSTYNSRLRNGWTIEEALTDTGQCKRFIPCTDHTGRKFPSLNAMCRAWYVTSKTYNERRERGWTLEEALTGTGPYRAGTPCSDHAGREYTSITAMCDHWGISSSALSNRLRNGWTLEEALTGKCSCTDHTGQTFPSQNAMCRAWGVNRHTFSERLARGWTLEQALTSPKQRRTSSCKHNASEAA